MNLKLNRLTDEQIHILQRVVEEYYVVLPAALKVHSLFATHILSQTLHHFGIRTRVLPCRLWCSLPRSDKEFTGGFVNFFDREKWNGHVVCLVGDWLVDAALYHLNPTFNYEVPKIIARRIALPEPGIYTRYQLNKTTEFVWYRLPPQTPAVTVTGYEDFIEKFVETLVAHINVLLGRVDESVLEPDAPISAFEEPVLDQEQALPELLALEQEPMIAEPAIAVAEEGAVEAASEEVGSEEINSEEINSEEINSEEINSEEINSEEAGRDNGAEDSIQPIAAEASTAVA